MPTRPAVTRVRLHRRHHGPQAFLVEALYHLLTYGTKARIAFDTIAEILRFTVDHLRIDDDPDALTAPLLVAETLD